MELDPLEADLLNWLFEATDRRPGVIVDSAVFLALHPKVDRYEVTTAVEILESLGVVKAFRTEAGAMKQVRLTPRRSCSYARMLRLRRPCRTSRTTP